MVPHIPALTRGHTGSQPCPSSSLFWDQVPRRACTKRAAPNALLPHGTGTSLSPRSALKTRAQRERAGSAPTPRGTGTAPEDRCLSPPAVKCQLYRED